MVSANAFLVILPGITFFSVTESGFDSSAINNWMYPFRMFWVFKLPVMCCWTYSLKKSSSASLGKTAVVIQTYWLRKQEILVAWTIKNSLNRVKFVLIRKYLEENIHVFHLGSQFVILGALGALLLLTFANAALEVLLGVHQVDLTSCASPHLAWLAAHQSPGWRSTGVETRSISPLRSCHVRRRDGISLKA